MKRRTFLGLGASSAALAVAWPGWIRSAVADTTVDLSAGRGFSDGQRRAQRSGKPLLVLIIPEDRNQRWRRGAVLAAWLLDQRDEALTPLALAEVVCARLAELPARLRRRREEGEPLLILLDGSGVNPVVHGTLEGKDEAADARKLAGLAHDLVAGLSARDTTRWAMDARERLSPSEQATLDEALRQRRGPPSPLSLVDRAAAIIYLSDLPRARASSWLASAARARLVKGAAPAGSRWAHDGGCGYTVDGFGPEQQRMVDCGMGHMDGKGRRFLYLFTEAPKDLR